MNQPIYPLLVQWITWFACASQGTWRSAHHGSPFSAYQACLWNKHSFTNCQQVLQDRMNMVCNQASWWNNQVCSHKNNDRVLLSNKASLFLQNNCYLWLYLLRHIVPMCFKTHTHTHKHTCMCMHTNMHTHPTHPPPPQLNLNWTKQSKLN